MKFPFKNKKKKTYTFLCKHCDIFFTTKHDYQSKCPGCGQESQLISVKEHN